MSARKTLYLLRRPIVDSAELLLPSASDAQSLVLLEEAVASTPSFSGEIYILQSSSASSAASGSGKMITYQDLVTLIAEHDATIVL
jgi:hypothetical protein